ncbi:hypothetical protein ACF0H5_020736 [Mactra antiquata]
MDNSNNFPGVARRLLCTVLFLVIFIGKALTQHGASGCPMEWKPYYTPSNELTCTWFSKNKASWIDAMSWCKVLNAQLVEIKTPQFGLHLMQSMPAGRTGKYWVGSTDMEKEMHYKWMTSGAATSLRLFDPSQIRSTTAKNCVSTDEKAYWTVEDCKAEFWFICQIIPTSIPNNAQHIQSAQNTQNAQSAQTSNSALLQNNVGQLSRLFSRFV